jgi:K+-transporting ATPase ATPase C chain
MKHLRPALAMTLLMTVLTGVLYPLAVTGLAQGLFPSQAGGSLVLRDRRPIGSSLIGQSFTSDRYFHGRPSAAGEGYDAASSSGANWGPTSKPLVQAISERAIAAAAQNPGTPVPLNLVTASASGLDPHLSPAAARFQIPRIARVRGLSESAVLKLVDEHVEHRTLGLFGEPRVNVLALNLALDALPGGTPEP